jgi:RNA polymerase sigma factor (sigma-70 family)
VGQLRTENNVFGRRQRAERFDRLIRPHVMIMYQSALRLLGDPHDAEDLVQDVLSKLYRRLSEVEKVEALRPWLLRVVYNAYVDFLRRQGRSPETVADDVAYEAAPERAEREPDLAYQQAELGAQLANAVAQLPEDQRAIVELHLVQGYTLQELAETLGTPLGTLKARVHRAKNKLRDKLDDATVSSV